MYFQAPSPSDDGGLVVVHQPQVLHPLHLLQRILRADTFVLMDKAQVNRKTGMAKYACRHWLTSSEFWKKELIVPLGGGHRVSCFEACVKTDDGWVRKHVETCRALWNGCMFAKEALRILERVLTVKPGETFAQFGELNLVFALSCALETGLAPPRLVRESDLPAGQDGENGSDRILRLVKAVGGRGYYCGRPEDRPYLDEAKFMSSGVRVFSQDFVAPPEGDLSWLQYYATSGAAGVMKCVSHGWKDCCPMGRQLYV